MFHCLDLLSQLESCEKKKKGTNCITFTTNSPEFCLIRKEKIEYIVNLCLSKTKTKKKENMKEKKKTVDFASAYL